MPLMAAAQPCSLQLSGKIIDADTGQPLESATVYVPDVEIGTVTDSAGRYMLENLCAGAYHLQFSHIGCASVRAFVDLKRDTTLDVTMEHAINVLHGVVVEQKASHFITQSTSQLSQQQIADHAGENLSNMLSSVVGISALKNGAGIAKPVLHGMYGNRLTLLNNGIAQSGQQWGNDHSPEIDPWVANKITVLKGVGALAYPGTHMGGIILVEPKSVSREPHLHGKAGYYYETNGRTHGLRLQLRRYTDQLAWQFSGSLKHGGDQHAADYWLTNTGVREVNAALQLEKDFPDRWLTRLYFSTFNTKLGVLRGSHIGNLTDLSAAFSREVPFFTQDAFSNSIHPPHQQVHHHLLKVNAKYLIDDYRWLDLTLAGQLNLREEFDVRRSGRSAIPALGLQQLTYTLEGKYSASFPSRWSLKSGLQMTIVDNTNDPQTGILPLIPDYISWEPGLFALVARKSGRTVYELGLRLDLLSQNVAAITTTIPREIIRYDQQFLNISASAGWQYELKDKLNLSLNTGFVTRNPAVNELFSAGLHQGVSGIEEGQPELKREQSLKTTIGLSGELSPRIVFEALAYYHRIDDYIYLSPDDEIRLTIRGAFPVFQYKQTDAALLGMDLSTDILLFKSWHVEAGYSFLRGNDLTHAQPLVNMPANRLSGLLKYEFSRPVLLGSTPLEQLVLSWEHQYTFRQNHLEEGQDFVPPPDAYYLMGASLVADIPGKKLDWRFHAKVSNLLNTSFRDYLNRQRYFADDMGSNVVLGLQLKF